ncbi:MAG: polysaccharide deacetylase family protein [Clostridia bacterium]|nr:polysaccharide deacetylase family protein [Clostridia bacterium]
MKFVVLRKKLLLIISLICLVCVTAFVSVGVVSVSSAKKRLLPIYSVKTDKKQIAISFDCAWGAEYTETLLSVMAERGVKCTFFTVQFWTEKYSDLIKKISLSGHEIGTHSKTHPNMSKLNKNQMVSELTSSKSAIENITNKKVELFRPPFGDYNDLLIETATELSLFTIQWSIDSLDWKNLSANEIVKRVVTKAKNGAIVLFHNNGLNTAKSLPIILDTLISQGYKFVPIGELIYKENYLIDNNGVQYAVKNS